MTNSEEIKNESPYLVWVKEYYTEFSKESDRAAVILCASMLENALEDYLLARLVPNPASSDSLFDGPIAPLSTFSSKIDFAIRLGIISDQFARDLNIIRRIRNEFAHNISGCSFNDAAARSRVKELMRSWKHLAVPRENLPEGTRYDFLYVTTWMLVTLRMDLDNIDPLEKASLEIGYSKDDLILENSVSGETTPLLSD